MALPLSVQNTYQDLVAAHLHRAVAEIPGTPFRREVAGRGYWYVNRRIGDRVSQRYLGPDSAEMRERIAQAKDTQEEEKAFRVRCSIMIAQLRATGLPRLDQATGKVLNALFQRSLNAAKAVRTETGVGRGCTSIGGVAVELARKIFGDLTRATVLLIGAGKIGESTLKRLAVRGVR